MEVIEGGDATPLSHLRPIEVNVKELEDRLLLLVKQKDPLEVTVTFREELRDFYKGFTLTNMVAKCFNRTRLQEGDYIEVIMVGEYSAVGHYHMHGIMRTTPRLVDLIRRKLKKEFGRVEIQQVRYPNSYVGYILKNDGVIPRKIYTQELIEISKSIPVRAPSSPGEHIDRVYQEYIEERKTKSI